MEVNSSAFGSLDSLSCTLQACAESANLISKPAFVDNGIGATIAELVGMGERNLSKIECGINFISADTLDRITKALKITPKELFDFEHLKDKILQKEELIEQIKNEKVDINLLYRIYQAIKK